jgi:hypothetical protein
MTYGDLTRRCKKKGSAGFISNAPAGSYEQRIKIRKDK